MLFALSAALALMWFVLDVVLRGFMILVCYYDTR